MSFADRAGLPREGTNGGENVRELMVDVFSTVDGHGGPPVLDLALIHTTTIDDHLVVLD